MLDRLQQFVDKSNETNSNTDKLAVLKQFKNDEEVFKALHYTYTPYKQYYVTAANCQKRGDLVAVFNEYDTVFDLLDALADREITGHAAISAVNAFVRNNEKYADLIWCMLDRNLKTRSTDKMINKVVPGTVPTFDVALAKSFDEKTKKKVDWVDGWFVSRKIDGCRCICIINERGKATFFSRQGKEFETLGNLKAAIEKNNLKNIVFDGEICIVDKDGNEDFASIMKEIRRKNHTIKNPKYLTFDCLTFSEFSNGVSKRSFSTRLEQLIDTIDSGDFNNMVGVLHQDRIKSDADLEQLISKANDCGWEGLILRKDVGYKGKRSDDLLKVKKFFDAEYTVLDVESSVHRIIVDGREVEEEMLKNVIIEHKGYRVDVGSGFSHDERIRFHKNPALIIGKTICVQYFEETANQEGGISLRFPTVKYIYENGRDV